MKFSVVYEVAPSCYSVNMVAAPTKPAAKLYAEAHAQRHGYTVDNLRQLSESDVLERLAKGMPITEVNEKGEPTK